MSSHVLIITDKLDERFSVAEQYIQQLIISPQYRTFYENLEEKRSLWKVELLFEKKEKERESKLSVCSLLHTKVKEERALLS